MSRERFARAYAEHAPQLFRYFWLHVGLRVVAEDLVSETFLNALHSLATYRPERGSLGAWLFGIARHALARSGERFTRRVRNEVDLEGLETIRLEGSGVSPEERIDLWQAVGELSDLEREIIALKFGAGLMHSEIAGLVGLRESHVGVLVYRALQRLRARLAGEGQGHA